MAERVNLNNYDVNAPGLEPLAQTQAQLQQTVKELQTALRDVTGKRRGAGRLPASSNTVNPDQQRMVADLQRRLSVEIMALKKARSAYEDHLKNLQTAAPVMGRMHRDDEIGARLTGTFQPYQPALNNILKTATVPNLTEIGRAHV